MNVEGWAKNGVVRAKNGGGWAKSEKECILWLRSNFIGQRIFFDLSGTSILRPLPGPVISLFRP